MRLKKLLVSGFKSFVDPTDIRVPSHLVGIVGPNGCGKSNVIDAVRWVMGETSARMLRGDNMEDVIFNGSSTRKPISRASVELIFDNQDGQAPGHYGQFAEISVKRTLTRDDQSRYLINHVKTRRKDVLDLFRGTGLGPRSYSIIEQGMVSRIVEARPEDLRMFVEEAAGTSRYKERRRETETRIAHTRENLDRVADIESELGKQLSRLQKQSATAERYKVLKSEQRKINGQLNVLMLNQWNRELQEQDRLTAKYENEVQKCLARQRETQAGLEDLRRRQADAHEEYNQVQQEFYQASAKISNLEQKIEHRKENIQRQTQEMERLQGLRNDYLRQISSETQKTEALVERLEEMRPDLESFQQSLAGAENQLAESGKRLSGCLTGIEDLNERSREPARQVEIQNSRMEHLRQQRRRTEQGKARLTEQITRLSEQVSSTDIDSLRFEAGEKEREHERAEKQFHRFERELKQIYTRIEQKREGWANLRTRLQEVTSRLQSLQEIQAAALGADRSEIDSWLTDSGFGRVSRLARKIKVADGWERAADRVLNDWLSAFCTSRISSELLATRPDSSLALVCPDEVSVPPANPAAPIPLALMSDQIIAEGFHVAGLVAGVYVAETLEQGLRYRQQLSGRECIVTRCGELIGANWIRFASQSQIETGVLVREDEIAQLLDKKRDLSDRLELAAKEIDSLNLLRQKKEAELETWRGCVADLRSALTVVHNQFSREETRYLEAREYLGKLGVELDELETQITDEDGQMKSARLSFETAVKETGVFDQERAALIDVRNQLGHEVSTKRKAVDALREQHYKQVLSQQKLAADLDLINSNIQRYQYDLEQNESRLSDLSQSDSSPDESVSALEEKLERLLRLSLETDKRFSAAKAQVAELDGRIEQANQLAAGQSGLMEEARMNLEQQKLSRREARVRRDALVEMMDSQGWDIEECSLGLPENASVEDWRARLEIIEEKVDRIGPVNLVAIDEFNEQTERMDYLRKQREDLTAALNTLEQVIQRIDRETRSRFRQTFDTINEGFNRFFPKLFGGGSARLFLTSDDLLTAGIGVMARPPGKRNTHIHLLSGGEKALTAVALLFSLFELNPAPFCMLDEVDAPLDDANVDRYCETLKTLADKSQMIVITHNKITMASMDLLVGVTMEEAGVSRLVSVDMERAMGMVA